MTNKEYLEILKELESKRVTEKMDVNKFILNHKYVNYCECIIYKDGSIAYVNPSHIENMIRETNKSRQEIYEIMPITASPLTFLIDYTECIAVWSNMYIQPKQGITEKQKVSLNNLLNAKLTQHNNN